MERYKYGDTHANNDALRDMCVYTRVSSKIHDTYTQIQIHAWRYTLQ